MLTILYFILGLIMMIGLLDGISDGAYYRDGNKIGTVYSILIPTYSLGYGLMRLLNLKLF